MASESDIFQALFGGTSNRGYSDLDQFEKTIQQNDLFRTASAPLLGAKFNTSTWSPMESLGVTAGTAFLGGLLNQLGSNSEAQQLAKVAPLLPSLFANPNSVTTPEGVDAEAFNQLKLSSLKQQDLRNAAIGEKRTDAKEKLFAEVFSKNPGVAISTMPDMAKKFDIQIPEQEPPKPIETPIDSVPGLATGKDSTAQKIKKYYQDFAETMPPIQAAAAARQQVQAEVEASKKTFDEAKAAREYGQKLLDLSNTAKSALSQTGKTGSFETGRELYDYLAANVFGDTEAENRRTGRQVLSSIAPEIVKMNRSPGAVSDFETKLYLGAGPNVKQTSETNALLAQKTEDLGKLNLDYADFLDAYREANGTTVGAQKKWSEYRQAFPIFIGGADNIQLNSNRPSWQEYFSGEATPQVSTAGVPNVGETFNNEKVISIKKIR